MKFDLLIRNGHVVDPLSGLDEKADLGIKDRKIAALRPNLSCSSADAVIDVEGRIVMPGVIDSHVHVTGKDLSLIHISLDPILPPGVLF